MKMQKLLRFFAPIVIMVGAAVTWWACEFERTIDHAGPSDPLNVKLTQLLDELASSKSQKEAEQAITRLLEKTGVGLPVKGSKYTENLLHDDYVSELAQEYLRHLRGEETTNWGEAFKFETLASDHEWDAAIGFESVTARLQQQASAALADPESPNHALLLAMVLPDNVIPEAIAAPAPTALISPVQEFLFEVWMEHEYTPASVLQKDDRTFEFTVKIVHCDGGKTKITHEELRTNYDHRKTKDCLQKVRSRYKADRKKCFKDYEKCLKKKKLDDDDFNLECCLALQQCLAAALEKAKEDIDDCLAGHDQGKGGDHKGKK
ncbi:hypothetical protein KJ068_24025 [bacterium]|nr:hypothetical protein [bacterium]